MSEQDVFAVQDKARGDYARAKDTLAAAKARANELAAELESVASSLRTQPWNIDFDSIYWLVPGTAKTIVSDISKAEAEVADKFAKTQELGIVV